MDAEIDPSADFIWASVGTVITKDGIDERQPRSAAEWKEVRRRAITLIEATNLLLLPHRRVAIPAFPSIAPGVLGSDEIQLKLNGNRAAFNALALTLRQAGLRVLQAIDRRDVPALSRAGEALDSACEACHIANWYPHQVIPSPSHFPPAQ